MFCQQFDKRKSRLIPASAHFCRQNKKLRMRGVRNVVIHALLILLRFCEGSAIHRRTPRVGLPVALERRADGDVAEERAAMVARQARDECIDATCIVLIYCERSDLPEELLGMHRCSRFQEDMDACTCPVGIQAM